MAEICGYCRRQASTLQRCSGCKRVYYCSRECQRKDWKGQHKAKCREVQNHVHMENADLLMTEQQSLMRNSEGHWSHGKCIECGKNVYSTQKCSRCIKMNFCSSKCLRQNWRRHQPCCAAVKEEDYKINTTDEERPQGAFVSGTTTDDVVRPQEAFVSGTTTDEVRPQEAFVSGTTTDDVVRQQEAFVSGTTTDDVRPQGAFVSGTTTDDVVRPQEAFVSGTTTDEVRPQEAFVSGTTTDDVVRPQEAFVSGTTTDEVRPQEAFVSGTTTDEVRPQGAFVSGTTTDEVRPQGAFVSGTSRQIGFQKAKKQSRGTFVNSTLIQYIPQIRRNLCGIRETCASTYFVGIISRINEECTKCINLQDEIGNEVQVMFVLERDGGKFHFCWDDVVPGRYLCIKDPFIDYSERLMLVNQASNVRILSVKLDTTGRCN